MFGSNLINDCESIDFDFFENEGNTVKPYLKYSSTNKNVCSKIVTKAIIETNSRHIDAPDQSEDICVNTNPSRNFEFDKDSHDKIFQQGIRGSLGESLCNSLAYSNSVIIQDSLSISSDDVNDNLDDSTSDSTITTISSDFTSVSSFSSVSNSSLASDVSLDFPTRTNENTMLNERFNCNFNDTSTGTQKSNSETGKIDSYECQVISEQVSQNETNKDKGLNYTIVKPDEALALMNKFTTNITNDCTPNELEYYDHGINKNDFPEHNRPLSTESIVCATEEELKNLSFSPQSSSTPLTVSTPSMRESSKLLLKRRKLNLTFSREELIKIERDNLTLLKKIMAHSKTRTIMFNNHSFIHKKASAAINRAKQQKTIEQDNYILYSKINAVGRMKNVC